MPRLTVTLPGDLAEEVRARAGRRGVSSWIAQAAAERLGRERLAAAIAEYEADAGLVTDEDIAAARTRTACIRPPGAANHLLNERSRCRGADRSRPGRSRHLGTAHRSPSRWTTPRGASPVIAQAWRGEKRQASLAWVLSGAELVVADEPVSCRPGELLGRARTTDVLDALVVLAAQDRPGHEVLPSDPWQIQHLLTALNIRRTIRVV